MECEHYFYNCSREYIDLIEDGLFSEVTGVLNTISKRQKQSELNEDIFNELVHRGWAYDSMPSGYKQKKDLSEITRIKNNNDRDLCLTTSTLDTLWHCDFAKDIGNNLVQMEIQFGKVESMFKDFCGFRIAYFEKRLKLGIEIVISEPSRFFAHRKNAISGMAYFNVAKNTLPAIGLDCPIWLIGLKG